MSVFFKSVRHSGLLACAGLAGLVLASHRRVRPGSAANHHVVPELHHHAGSRPRSRSTTSARWRSPTSAASAAISAAIGNVSTAFLTQQGSAFVSAPADPAPDQPGGGVWARGVGGQANITSTSNSVGVSTQGGAVINTATTNCNNQQRQTFAGAQVGTDIARLNYAGWNLHLGTTAGYLSSRTTDNAGFGNEFEVPFWGTYFVATKGRFFADLMVRQEFYNINLNNPALRLQQPAGRGARLVDLGIDGL